MPTLSWNVVGAQTVSIDQGIGVVAAVGSVVVNPTVITTYTLTAVAADGRVNTDNIVLDPNNIMSNLDAFD